MIDVLLNSLFSPHNVAHMLRGLSDTVNRFFDSNQRDEEEDDPYDNYFLCLLAMLAKMAKVDGRVTRDENQFLYSILDELDCEEENKRYWQQFYNEQKAKVDDIFEFAAGAVQSAAEMSPDDEGGEILIATYRFLFLMALADGELNDKEIALLQILPEHLGLEEEVFDDMEQELLGGGEEEAEPEDCYMDGLLAMLAKMAKADGRVSKPEIQYINNLLDGWGIEGDTKNALQQFCNEQKQSVDDIFEVAEGVAQAAAEMSPDDDGAELLVDAYRHLFIMALVDETLDDEELNLLRALPPHLNLKEEIFDLMAQELAGNSADGNRSPASAGSILADAYTTLGVSPDASDAEVRDAWKKKMAAFHPDRIQGKDLAPEWLELANQKSAEINQAYETIKASRR